MDSNLATFRIGVISGPASEKRYLKEVPIRPEAELPITVWVEKAF